MSGRRILVIAVGLLAFGVGARQSLAEEKTEKFRMFAYLTQAYGFTDGPQLLGLAEDGATDYRNAAVQFRFTLSRQSEIVFQLAHERLGASPLGDLRDDVILDWAFFRHSFGPETSVRVGRFPTPFGIYNEIRDVGTVLEFYRPPVSIYFEGAFASESIDGASLSHDFFADKAWNLDVDLYYGSWDRPEFLAASAQVAQGKAKDGVGIQLWLNTPLPGLRLGAAAQRFDYEGGLDTFRSGDSDRFTTYLVSLDADFSRFFFRAEAQEIDTQFFATENDVSITSYYGLVGFRATDKLALHVVYEDSKDEVDFSPAPSLVIDPFHEDFGVSLVYRFKPQVLLRLEGHSAKSALVEEQVGSELSPSTDYYILSLSTSF